MTTVMTSRGPRERMVRSAALLFRERGVGGTGMRDVVEHAEAPRGSLQHYFPGGKEQLLVEAMAWMAERAARPLHAALAAPVPPSPGEVVDGLLDRFREVMTLTGFRGGCPIVAGVADASWDSPAVTAGAREAFATWLTPLQAALERGGLPADRAASDGAAGRQRRGGGPGHLPRAGDASALDAVQEELADPAAAVEPRPPL